MYFSFTFKALYMIQFKMRLSNMKQHGAVNSVYVLKLQCLGSNPTSVTYKVCKQGLITNFLVPDSVVKWG